MHHPGIRVITLVSAKRPYIHLQRSEKPCRHKNKRQKRFFGGLQMAEMQLFAKM
jgi:hypothetical protein